MPALTDEVRAAGTCPDVPLIALTTLGIDPGMRPLMPGRALRRMTGASNACAAPADFVTHGEQSVLGGARHSTVTAGQSQPRCRVSQSETVRAQVSGASQNVM